MITKTVLIADNNKDFANILRLNFERNFDIQVIGIAENGFQAINMIKEKKPDVVLLDIVMPCIDGLEVLTLINAIIDYKPIVFIITVFSAEKILSQAVALGATYIILKPFNIESIILKIRELN